MSVITISSSMCTVFAESSEDLCLGEAVSALSSIVGEVLIPVLALRGSSGSPYVLVDLSAVLAVTAVDECLQALVGRTGMVRRAARFLSYNNLRLSKAIA